MEPTFKNSLPFKSYCRNGERSSHFNTFPKWLTLVNYSPLKYFFPQIWFWDNWSCDIRKTSIFTPLNCHIIGIRISGNPVDHIETTITLLIFIKEGQNFWSNSCLEFLLSKTFCSHFRIPYCSKVIVATVSEVHISTYFQCH